MDALSRRDACPRSAGGRKRTGGVPWRHPAERCAIGSTGRIGGHALGQAAGHALGQEAHGQDGEEEARGPVHPVQAAAGHAAPEQRDRRVEGDPPAERPEEHARGQEREGAVPWASTAGMVVRNRMGVIGFARASPMALP